MIKEAVDQAKILVVEDERIVALDIAASLENLGYDVVGIASTGNEAINLVKQNPPDLVLMDIGLKGNIDGINTAEQIQKLYDVSIIYLTAYSDENTLGRAKITGPYGYLLKPFDKKILRTTLEMALYKKKIERQLRESERWLGTILNNIGDAIIALDSEGKITLINPIAEKLTGLKKSEALGEHFDDTINIFYEGNRNGKITISRLEQDENKTSAKVLKNKYGIERSILTTISFMYDDQGSSSGSIIVFHDVTEKRKIEKEKERLFQRVHSAQERLKVLSRRLIEIQESERRHIARELHDEIGQVLTAIKINIQTSLRFTEMSEVIPQLNDSVELVENALSQVRNLSVDLRPSMLDDLGLLSALRWYVDKQSQRTSINGKVISTVNKRYPAELEITCFRLTQEAITNIIKHSEATVFTVEIWEENDELHIRIIDNGKGFNVYSALKRALAGASLGILGMQERVELAGGRLNINSNLDKGTDIHAVFSLHERV
jgi:PAS domain S-box-containing protein